MNSSAVKKCSTCQQVQEVAAFSRNRTKQDGLQNTCKKCQANHTRHWKYSLANGDIQRMMEAQDHRCAICATEAPLLMDHCHRTGKIRKLLCRKCNTMLGMADDNPAVLAAAIQYLAEE